MNLVEYCTSPKGTTKRIVQKGLKASTAKIRADKLNRKQDLPTDGVSIISYIVEP